jgi:hypothetical protein
MGSEDAARRPPPGTDFVRLTRWGDYEGYKASNPVVSNDGRRIAFQSACNNVPLLYWTAAAQSPRLRAATRPCR